MIRNPVLIFVLLFIFSCSDDPTSSNGGNFETGTVSDIDGNVYKTVKIGDQWWMAENLKVIRYRNGEPISHVSDSTVWSNLSNGAYCEYDNNSANVSTYGRLYNWYSVNDSRSIAPAGWHVPTDVEWRTLVSFLGGISMAGSKLKEAGTSHWFSPNTGATNESGFTALPSGYRGPYGEFGSMGYYCSFWSSTDYDSSGAFNRYLSYNNSGLNASGSGKPSGYIVRCVKDN